MPAALRNSALNPRNNGIQTTYNIEFASGVLYSEVFPGGRPVAKPVVLSIDPNHHGIPVPMV
jgi:hypothetical protein